MVLPPAGAGMFTVMLPVPELPTVSVFGVTVTLDRVSIGVVIVKMADWEEAPMAAVIVTICCVVTGSVVTRKVTLALPAGTVTLGTNCAAFELLVSVTSAPPPGAAAVSVTVHIEVPPPPTVAGLSATLATIGEGTTARVAVCVELFSVAMIIAFTGIGTPNVVIGKVIVVAFCCTVTLAGTCAALVMLLESITTAPPPGAAPEIVTVPVTGCPPTTGVTLNVRLLTVSAVPGVTVTIVVTEAAEDPCKLAVTVAMTWVVLAPIGAVTENGALVAPAGIVTLGGTVSAGELLESVTHTPTDEGVHPVPAGAGMLSATLPVAALPDVSVLGDTATLESVSEGTIVSASENAEVPTGAVTVAGHPVDVGTDAVTVTPVVAVTAVVCAVNCICTAPCGTVTIPGTMIGSTVPAGVAVFVNPAVRHTTAPPAGAGGEIDTVPVVFDPPATVDGIKFSPVTAVPAGRSRSCPCSDVEFRLAVSTTLRGVVTADVKMLNVALVAPVITVTGLTGTTAVSLLTSVTGWPGENAGALIVTVPLSEPPLVILGNSNVKPVSESGLVETIVRPACMVSTVPKSTLMATSCVEPTGTV
jgi:hypothetical protein